MYGFKLRQESQDEGFSGGTVNCTPLGHTFDVGAALEAGDGTIYTDDAALTTILRGYPALEEVDTAEVPSDATPVEVPGQDDLQSVTELPPVLQGEPPEVLAAKLRAIAETEISAEHEDQGDSAEAELKQGEAVSGLGSRSFASASGGSGGSSISRSGTSPTSTPSESDGD